MEPRRYLRCLGQPSLLAPSGEPIRFRTKKHLALLINLAEEGTTQRRERLAELLWPNVTPTEGRHSLATALSTLRPRLGPEGLETSRDHVRLSPGRVERDLDRLEAGDVLGTEVTGVLEVAAFLDGFDIVDSPEFNHWRDRQQARLLPAIKDALVVLIDRCRRTGDTRQIERLADRMLARDELSEEAIRAKMEARAFAGDRLTALEFFEEWKKKLADELQAVPSDLVEGMAVRLRRRGWERTTSTNIPTVPTDQWRGRPFIGRTGEYQVLYELWEGVQRGEPGHALILGDSGVGKTTLVEKLTTAAGLEGAAISRVQCYDLEREIPYSTVSSLILGLLDRPGVSATAPESLAELARTVPEVRHRFPNIPAPSESQGEAARIRLTEAFYEVLAAIAEEHPVILVVDDLHLADDVSLAVLHLMMRRARGQPIMVLLLARPGELSPSTHAGLLRESASALAFREIRLSPLSGPESRELLRSLFGSDEHQPNPGAQRVLLAASAGYPMVLELLVEDWKANGSQSLLLAVDSMTADLSSNGTLPDIYGRILTQAERSLTPAAHNVLKLASILGHRLNDLTMYALADLSIAQTTSGLAELVSRRFLRDSGQGLEFVNELVRTAVYLGIPGALRKVLHSQVADGFLDQERGSSTTLGLEIAWHCMRGGRTDEATIHLLNGAREAVRCGALQAAERGLSTAIPQLSATERTEAILLLLEILQEQGRWSESLQVLLETPPEDTHDATLVFSVFTNYMLASPTTEQMLLDVRDLCTIIEGKAENWIRIRAARAVASMMTNLGDPSVARKLLNSVASIPKPNAPEEIARLADIKARLLYFASDRRSCLNELLDVAEQLRGQGVINSTVASLHTGLGIVACGEGRYLDANAELRRAHNIYTGLGNDTVAGCTAAQVALTCFRLGEYAEAIEWCRVAAGALGTQFGGYLECQVAMYAASSHAFRGENRMAQEAINRLESRMPATTPPWMIQAWHLHKADILFILGNYPDALQVGREAIGAGGPLLLRSSFAGPFARWVFHTSVGTTSQPQARAQIEEMMGSLEKYDAVDQVEILCAGNSILKAAGMGTDNRFEAAIRRKLANLPPTIPEHLQRLGVLTFDPSGAVFPDSDTWPTHAL